jgi:Ferritin-like domain
MSKRNGSSGPTDLPALEEIDLDGAIREAAGKVGGDTRGAFLRKAGLGAGALVGGGAFFGALPTIASAGVAASDVAILNFALTLEYLEAAFYAEAVSKGRFGGKVGKFAHIVAGHEAAHVSFLKGALGSAAVKKPQFDFKDMTTNRAKFMATAQVLEDTGVAAYLGQVGNIKSKKILGAAGSILPIEARHAGWIRDLNNVSGAPTAFEAPKTQTQILTAVKGTGFIV